MILRAKELSQLDPTFANAIERCMDERALRQEEVEALLGARGREFSVLLAAGDAMRRRLVGDTVTYVVNRNLNFTNICNTGCAFCGFARRPDAPDAYLLSMEEVREKVREARDFGATEICAQGGINPRIDLGYALELLRTVKEEMPNVHIHAFSPMEIDHLASEEGLSVREVLTALVEEGLGSMPGTAAEILVEDVRRRICPGKISAARWEEIILEAHEMGIPTTSTMMYGTVETIGDRASHLLTIRGIQERTHGFTEFVPLPFVHGRSPISRFIPSGPGGAEDLRVIATARLVFGSLLPNIQVSWVKMGRKLAQIGLNCGANDFGGTLMEENISRSAGASTDPMISPAEFIQMISDLGRKPAQRDTLYRIIG